MECSAQQPARSDAGEVQNYGNDSNSYQNRANHLDQSFSSAKSALQAKLESIRSMRPAPH